MTLHAPYFAYNSRGWNTNFQVQNVDGDDAKVQRTYYYLNGNDVLGSEGTWTIGFLVAE